jgi:hypothetical protein
MLLSRFGQSLFCLFVLILSREATARELFVSSKNDADWSALMPLKSYKSGDVGLYLDSDKRPNAKVITPSVGSFTVVKNQGPGSTVSFVGMLGAIASSRQLGSYVGFVGIEVQDPFFGSFDEDNHTNDGQSFVNFKIDSTSDLKSVLSVELVVAGNDEQFSYSKDFPLVFGLNSFAGINVNQFVKSVRGVPSGEVF